MHFFTSSANATGCPLLPLSLSFFLSFFLLLYSHLVLSLSLSLFLVLFIPLFLCLSIFPHFHLFSSIYFFLSCPFLQSISLTFSFFPHSLIYFASLFIVLHFCLILSFSHSLPTLSFTFFSFSSFYLISFSISLSNHYLSIYIDFIFFFWRS